MAIWQYSTHLISNEELLKNRNYIPESITEDEREGFNGWKVSSNLKVIDDIVSEYLDKKKSWSEDIEQWGDEDSHCVQIYCDEGSFSEVFIRLDLRNLKNNFLDLVVKLAESLNASGLDSEGNIIELSLRNLKSEITTSDAFKFVKDPQGFLASLSE